MLRKILQFILKILARLVLRKYKPVIVAVTGSVGKTSTKEAIYTILKNHFGEREVRRNQRNYNNEIGVPLTIFGLESGGKNLFIWCLRFLKVFWMLVFKQKYPKILVVEMGADKPGDIEYLTNFIKPNISVITAIGEVPVHVEFFESPQQLALEKKKLIDVLDKEGIAVLNYDDPMVYQMGKDKKCKIITYGFSEGADVRAINYESRLANSENSYVYGFTGFKAFFKGSLVPVKLNNVLGKHQIYPALAGISVGLVFGLNLIEMSEALSRDYQTLPGRMKLIKGIKNTLIIDDTYNAAPLSTSAAIKTLREISEQKQGSRTIAVLGDMLELGRYAPEVHEEIGREAAEVVDYLLTVGERARFIAEGAIKKGLAKDRLFSFCTSEEAGKFLQGLLKENDIILVKGSRAMKMEKVVEEIMSEPEKAKTLLV